MVAWADPELAADYAELGAAFQTFAQADKDLSVVLARVGDAVDSVFLSTRYLVSESETMVFDPLLEYEQYVGAIRVHALPAARRPQGELPECTHPCWVLTRSHVRACRGALDDDRDRLSSRRTRRGWRRPRRPWKTWRASATRSNRSRAAYAAVGRGAFECKKRGGGGKRRGH